MKKLLLFKKLFCLLSFLVFLFLLAGCARYTKPGVGTRETGDDEEKCHYSCFDKLPWGHNWPSVEQYQLAMGECKIKCMAEKGYRPIVEH